MEKFTPGKWKAFYGENFHTVRQILSDNEHDNGDGTLIAHIVQWHEGHDWANAQLIAASPAMYGLVKEMARPSGKNYQLLEQQARELLLDIDGEEYTRTCADNAAQVQTAKAKHEQVFLITMSGMRSLFELVADKGRNLGEKKSEFISVLISANVEAKRLLQIGATNVKTEKSEP